MSQTIISVTHDTNQILSNQRVIDMSNQIALLQPSASPLTLLLQKLQKKEATNPKFEWMEDDLLARWDKVNYAAGYSLGTETDIVVTNITYFAVNDIVKVPRTGECMLVTAVTSSGSHLTVTRAYGTTAGTAIIDQDYLVIIGNANQEGATSPTIKSTQVVEAHNYTQIFRKPFGTTETLKASELYGGDDLSYQRKKAGIEHAVDIERAFLFGQRYQDLGLTKPQRTTGGILSFLSSNASGISGVLDNAKLESFCQSLFKYGSDTKFMFCSPIVLSAISGLAKERLQTFPKDQTYGINITRYISPHGELNLIKHRLLENAYDGFAIAVDLKNLWYRPLRGRDTVLKTNVQANNADEEQDEYITEAGLQLQLEQTHGYMYGVTG